MGYNNKKDRTMGKAARKKRSQGRGANEAAPRAAPNRPLLALAVLGMALSGYLTISAWSGEALAGCAVGSACDVVLGSRWSKLFGLPTSLWGFLVYAALAWTAFLPSAHSRWRLAWTLALFGVLFSLYLTAVALFQLDTACPYCLASLALMAVILGLVAYQRPDNLPGFAWPGWLARTVPAALVAVLALHLHFAGILGTPAPPEDPGARALAEHLVKTDAKFYGASWCPHCQDQKELFGASADRLPYVECSPQGRRTPMSAQCRSAGVEVYPTWIIDGRSYKGMLTLKELAELSRFPGSF
jgi:uncharacterized membrane protein